MKPTKPTPQAIQPAFKAISLTGSGTVRRIAPSKVDVFARPDWKSTVEYSKLSTASLRAVAWEFLRRNPDYQQAWSEYEAQVRKIASAEPDVLRYAELILSNDLSAEAWNAFGSQDKLDDLNSRLESLGFYSDVNGGDQSIFAMLDQHYGRGWGLETIVNPATSYSSVAVRFVESASVINDSILNMIDSSDSDTAKRPGLRDTKWMAMLVDLSLPLSVIDAQLKEAVRFRRQSKIEKGIINPITKRDVSPKKYAEYLRILDAYAAGVKAPEIGKYLEPNRTNDGEARQRDKAYSASLKVALDLQKEGYRLLPLLEFRWGKTGRKK